MDSSLTTQLSELVVSDPPTSSNRRGNAKQATVNGNGGTASSPGPSETSQSERRNPWKARQLSNPTEGNTSGSDNHSQQVEAPGRSSGNFEPSAWPDLSETSERRNTMEEKPKNRKPARNKWQQMEIEFLGGRGRGGARVQSSSSSQPSSNSQMPQGNSYPQTSRGGGPRRGAPNGTVSTARGRGNRPVNGFYPLQSRQPDAKRSNEPHVEIGSTLNSTVESGVSQPVEAVVSRPNSTATVYAGRGNYSGRPRRPGGSRGGFTGGGYGLSKGPSPNAPVLQAAGAAQGMPVTPVTYIYSDMIMPPSNTGILPVSQGAVSFQPSTGISRTGASAATVAPVVATHADAAILDGNALILSQLQATQSINVPPTPQASPAVPAEVVSLEDMLDYISEVGWSKARIPEHVRSVPAVASAMKENEITSATGDHDNVATSEKIPAVKKDDVVSVEDRVFFVPRNAHLTKFLKLKSKGDYIRHHVDYYFSEGNLQRDMHLNSVMAENENICPVESLLSFNRLRWVNCTEAELLQAIVNSPTVRVVYGPNQQPTGVAPLSTTLLRLQNLRLSTGSSQLRDSAEVPQISGHVSPQQAEVSVAPAAMPAQAAVSQPFFLHPQNSTVLNMPINPSHLVPYPSGIPGLPAFHPAMASQAHYFFAAPSTQQPNTSGAGDHQPVGGVVPAETAGNLYYRTLMTAVTAANYAPAAAVAAAQQAVATQQMFSSYNTNNPHQQIYFSLLPSAGSNAAAASNQLMRGAGQFFAAGPHAFAYPHIQQQQQQPPRYYTISRGAPTTNRPPSSRSEHLPNPQTPPPPPPSNNKPNEGGDAVGS